MDREIMIALIVLAVTVGWLINNWIRAKHGYPLENDWGGLVEKTDTEENKRLRVENRELNDKLDTMQDRMIVLEKIVTDRGYSLHDEIEALRDTRTVEIEDSGTPLRFEKREMA